MAERLVSAVWRVNKILPLLIGAFLLLNAAVWIVKVYHVAPSLYVLEDRLANSQSRARTRSFDAEAAVSPAEAFRQGERDLGLFKAAFPGRSDFTAFLAEIFSLASQAGLTIEKIAYNPEEMTEWGLLRYSLSFSVQGDYNRVKRFIHSLEQSSRILAIDGVSLSGAGQEKEAGVSLSIRLTTYFRSDRS
jgi:type IV pilus assembly protein PilO